MTGSTAHVDGHVITQNLGSDHGQSLTLCRVHFTRHDGRTRLIIRDMDLPDTCTRT